MYMIFGISTCNLTVMIAKISKCELNLFKNPHLFLYLPCRLLKDFCWEFPQFLCFLDFVIPDTLNCYSVKGCY